MIYVQPMKLYNLLGMGLGRRWVGDGSEMDQDENW